MALPVGSKVGPYEVLAPLGAGGMGEVYRARDTKLDRDVALKILPESFATDPDRLMRFQREAKVLAALNHPNIATIYGLTEKTSEVGTTSEVVFRALVMELVEGEDLSEIIAAGSKDPALHQNGAPGLLPRGLSVVDALPIARQIAEALEAAHELGIVHRDLKPANIKVRADGTVKVLDFGLAKAMESVGRGFSRADPGVDGAAKATPYESPTMTSPAMTAMGMILGTAAYMSPEQAKGRPVDKRADIWAFGAVLYEMLSGRRAFQGEDVSDLLVAVLSKDVDWSALPPTTPASIRTLLARCLERDPKRRLRDIGEAWLVLSQPDAPPVVAQAPPPARFASRPALGLIMALSVAAATFGVLWYRATLPGSLPLASSVRFPLVPDSNSEVLTGMTQPFGISPDGRTVVFSVQDAEGAHLWVRTLDAVAPRRLEGTRGGMQPAVSPNGEWVAFVVGNYQLRKVRLSGGSVTDIATIANVTAALTWLSNDEIAFEMIGNRDGIHRVRATGGTPELLIPLDTSTGERGQRRPLALRSAGVLIYTSVAADDASTLVAYALRDRRRVPLDLPAVQALGLVSDHLVYTREDGVLMAAPFDAVSVERRGDPVQLDDEVLRTGTGTPAALSESGTLVFSPPGSATALLLTRDSTGLVTAIGSEARTFTSARLSRDGKRIAVSIGTGDFQELWVIDRQTGEGTRVTNGDYDTLVDWTFDERALLHLRGSQIWTTPIDRSAPPQRLVKLEGRVFDAARGPVESSVFAVRMNQEERSGLWRVSVPDGAETPVVTQASVGRAARPYQVRLSPDGKWVAYTDRDEEEVHVHALDGSGRAIQVSAKGGSQPIWGETSQQLFYRTSEGLVRARIYSSPSLGVERTSLGVMAGSVEDVSRDGATFLIIEPRGDRPAVQIAFGWADAVRRQLLARTR